MDYMELKLVSKDDENIHGSTSDQITIDIRLDNAPSTKTTFDVFYLTT